jgi:exonuclease III
MIHLELLVSIWIKKNVEFKLIDEYKDNERRLLLINVEISNAIYTIINIYAPNNMNKRNTFFKQVDRLINEYIATILELLVPLL